MIDPSLFKNDTGLAQLKKSLNRRNEKESIFGELIELNKKRRELMTSSENLQGKRNTLSKEIGQLQSAKSSADQVKIELIKTQVRVIGEDLKRQKDDLVKIDEDYEKLILMIPNMLDEDVPDGKGEEDNKVVYESGVKPEYKFVVKPHYEIAENLDLVDFKRGVKLSGSRFYVYNAEISKLERKLIDFLLTTHEKKGYKERTVPYLVADPAMYGTGQLPKFAGEFYRLESDGLNLIPTAEVPLTNLYADEILSEDQLPVYLASATACFRREAGSAGKDTRGLIRVHQFQKVELVKFVAPETSSQEHEKLTADAEDILKKFNLHYRKLLLCSADTSFSSAKTYDLEVWLPGLDRWMEISSCSNFRDFQARRAKIRYKNASTGKNELVHTINGSGVALGRLIAALLEYYQTPEGNIDFDKIYSFIK
jgi:seryl-tRNA synthetase